MTNPDNAVGTNAAYGGRTSANAFNDDLAAYSRGVMSGWACAPSSGLTVVVGGDGSTRDVAVAEDNAGNKTTINNISGAPIEVTIGAAPAANSRIDAIVAYVDNPPQGSSTIADNYEACGLIAVAGTAASSPIAPTDGAIRSAITADGASGATAYYVVLATVTIASGTTDITANDITAGSNAMIQARNVGFSTFGGNSEPVVLSSSKSVGSTYTDFNSYTIPATGLYFLRLQGGNGSSTTKTRVAVRYFFGSTEKRAIGDWSSTAWSGNNFCECWTSDVWWIEAGTVVKTQGQSQNATSSVTVSLTIQRIF